MPKALFLIALTLWSLSAKYRRQNEVLIDVLYCGICHSDVHQVKNDWGNTLYPCVPGHEVIGKVAVAGSSVTKFKVGDAVGVGCMIDSCGICPSCQEKVEITAKIRLAGRLCTTVT